MDRGAWQAIVQRVSKQDMDMTKASEHACILFRQKRKEEP